MNTFSVATNPFWKTRKCRAYHKDKLCMYGVACLYKHEQPVGKRKNKHYYIPNLAKVPQMFSDDWESEGMRTQCLSGAQRLPIFDSIHGMEGADSTAESEDSQTEDDQCGAKLQESSEEDGSTDTDLDSN